MEKILWVIFVGVLCCDAQEANFGKKVKCFVLQGEVVCPGCNYRAGLSCPRNTQYQSCMEPQPVTPEQKKIPPTTPEPTEEPETPPPTTMNYSSIFSRTQRKKYYYAFGTTSKPRVKFVPPTEAGEELNGTTGEMSDPAPWDMMLYLYGVIRPGRKSYSYWIRPKRDLETCNWNGDCACPLICCRMGEGCPKKCMVGIRLPPPWG